MKASMILSLGAAAAVSADYAVGTGASTTSTVYSTHVYTISKCAATVTNCPYTTAPAVTTDIISLYVTVCPVTATETTPPPYPTSAPGGAVSSAPVPPPASYPGGAVSSAPIPPPVSVPGGPVSSAPAPPTYPTSAPAGPVLSTITISTCIPSYITSVITVTPSSAPAGPTSYPSGGLSSPPKNSTTPFVPANGASAKTAGGLLMAVGLIAALL